MIILPLKIIFATAIKTGTFPDCWKKGNIIPVHKKESKNIVKNYRPISLLPIFAKQFEKIIFNHVFEYFDSNGFLSEHQSGFRSGDSCISQLLSITHEIYLSFDANPSLETRGVFLDISEAFDMVWHKGLLHKLKTYGIGGSLFDLIENYLKDRKQRVVLNGQSSPWLNIEAGVPQGSVLGPLFFLIYINDLSDNLSTTVKLFADDTSIFSTVYNAEESSEKLNNDLKLIHQWEFNWRMSFNPDPNKQATEVLFSRKIKPNVHQKLYFNNLPVMQAKSQKHLGIILDEKLSFKQHLNEKIAKANKGIGLIRRLYVHLSRKSLLTIYKAFVRPHLDYGDVIYDQPHNESFCDMIESVQYNATLAITGAIKGTSKERLYQELGVESIRDRRWYRRLVMFHNIVIDQAPLYLCNILPIKQRSQNPSKSGFFRNFNVHTDYFKNSYFPYCTTEWNKLGVDIRSCTKISKFKQTLLDFIRPKPNSVYNINDPLGLKLLTRLRLNFSHLREHKFNHNFKDTVNPLCSCSLEVESTSHYLLRCPFYINIRKTLLDSVIEIIGDVSNLTDGNLLRMLLFGNEKFSTEKNAEIIKSTIIFIKSIERFDVPLIIQA